MAWYYYTGNTIRPIPVAKGRSVAVRPHTKFEVFDEALREVQDLASRGVIRKTGNPHTAKQGKSSPVPKIDPKAIPLPQFSKSIAEKGVTSKKGLPPRTTRPVEMTEGEATSLAAGASIPMSGAEDENDRGKGRKDSGRK